MGNLGLYQLITTVAKKVGGPRNLIALTLGGGYCIGRLGEAVVKKGYSLVRAKIGEKEDEGASEAVFKIKKETDLRGGPSLRAGDKFRILATDGSVTLIEVLGDNDNPFFVDASQLEEISDYRHDDSPPEGKS